MAAVMMGLPCIAAGVSLRLVVEQSYSMHASWHLASEFGSGTS